MNLSFFFRALIVTGLILPARAALTGHWPLDEGTGTAAANLANAAFPGTLTGFTAGSEWIEGAPGKGMAVHFDGTDDLIHTAFPAITGGAERTLAAWIKYPAQSDTELDAIFSYGANTTGNRWTVRIGSGAGSDQNRLRLEVSGAGVYGGTNLNDDRWHHIAVVQTTAVLSGVLLYVDGVPETPAYNGAGSAQAINTAVAAGQEAAAGGSRHAANYNFRGGIDDVRFYSHALSAAEVQALASRNAPPALAFFGALPGNLLPGQTAALSWSGSALPGAVWSLIPEPGDVTALTVNGTGQVQVAPAVTTVYTLRVTDGNGTASATATVGVNEPQLHPVINEVMAANDGAVEDENGDTPDWIELRNPNAFAISAAGYHLRDGGGSDWVFPADTTMAAHGYLRVFASGKNRIDPQRNLHTGFSLSSGGEALELRAPSGTAVVDAMPGDIVFPDNVTWGHPEDGGARGYLASPTPGAANSAAGQPGPRIEAVRTGLTGDTGRERQPKRPVLESGSIAADSIDQFSGIQGDFGWRYGFTTATALNYTPAGFTAFPGGDDDTAWSAATQNWNPANTQWGPSWERGPTAPPNTGLGADYTLPGLTGGTGSPVRRWTSSFTGPAVLSGFFHHAGPSGDGTRWQVFLNGVPQLDADPAAAGMQPFTVKTSLRRFAVPVNLAAGDLVDMVCDALASETGDTSRGWLRVWRHPESEVPAVHDAALPVAVRCTATAGSVTGATLFYAINFGAEQPLIMTQTGPDWTAAIPLAGVRAGDMIRWRIAAADSTGGSRTSPPFPSPLDSPKYHGTVAAGSGSQSLLGGLSLFMDNPGASETSTGTRASLFWKGRFYDNIRINLHSSGAYAKRSWDVDFNQGHRFTFTENGAGHTDINLLTNWRDRSKLRNPQSYHMFRLAGHPTLPCETVRLELNGLFHSTCDLTGELNEGVLEEAGLDKNGALYKMQNLFNASPSHATSGVEKRTRKWEPGNADLAAYLAGLVTLSNTDDRTGPVVRNSPRFRFLADQADLAATVNFITAMFWSSSYDWGHKNYALYHDNDGTGRWTPVPWDLDLSWGHYYDSAAIANTYFDDVIRVQTNDGTMHHFSLYHNQMEFAVPNKNALFGYLLEDPTTKAMILRRLRNLADQYLLPAGPAPEIEGRMNELTRLVDPPGAAESDADLDLRIWGYWNQHQTATNTYTPRSAREETARILDTFVPARRGMIFQNNPPLGAGYGGPVPGSQPAAPAITFGSWDAHPASGNQDHEYLEIVNESPDYVDLTGWSLTGGVSFTFPAGSVISPPGNTRFDGRLVVAKSGAGWRSRAASPKAGEGRFVLMAYAGQLSTAGETVELRNPQGQAVAVLTVPPSPGGAQQWLRVTEVHYQPLEPSAAEIAAGPLLTAGDFEFIEVMNTGTVPLDVSGCCFDEGVTFTFPPDTLLDPGQRAVVARNPAALALRSPGLAGVYGPFTGGLDNKGERLTLRDATGEQIVSFVYDNKSPWPVAAAGTGPGLVLITPRLDPDFAENWRAGTAVHGNPGASDTVAFTGDPAADADGDSQTALLEYALGTSESAGGDVRTPVWNQAAQTLWLDHAAAADDAETVMEVTRDLAVWDSSGALLRTGSEPLPGGLVRTTWVLPPSSGGEGRLYFRARVRLRP